MCSLYTTLIQVTTLQLELPWQLLIDNDLHMFTTRHEPARMLRFSEPGLHASKLWREIIY